MGKRVGLIGPFGGGNLGDAAIQEAAMRSLRSRGSFEFMAICGEPEGASEAHGIAAHPINADVWSDARGGRIGRWLRDRRYAGFVEQIAGSLDLLVFSGGGQFDDYWGGPGAHPWAIRQWTRAAVESGVPVAIASVGVDDLQAASAKLIRQAVDICEYVSLRDQGSLDLAVEQGVVPATTPIVADLAYSVVGVDSLGRAAFEGDGPVTIGISPISAKALPSIGHLDYGNYLRYVQDFAVRRLREGSRIVLFVSQVKMDREPQLELHERIGGRLGADERSRMELVEVKELDGLFAAIEQCDIIVASRLHSLLLSHVHLRPTVALSALRKVDQLMSDTALDDFNLQLSNFNDEDLYQAVAALESRATEAIAGIRNVVTAYQGSQADQFDILARLPETRRV